MSARVYFLLIFFFFSLIPFASSAAQLFFDGFESGTLIQGGWNLRSASGAQNWTNSTADPSAGTRHAQSNPLSTTTPASIIWVNVSTLGYTNINISYRVKRVGIDAADEVNITWFNGSQWGVLEATGGGSANDAVYLSRNWSLGANASNRANITLKFECTAGGATEFCRVDNVNITGDLLPDTTPPDVTINHPANATLSPPILFNVTLNENGTACNFTLSEGVVNYTMQNNGNRDFNATNESIAAGSYMVRYYCWDTSNNLNNSETRVFSVSAGGGGVSYFINISESFVVSDRQGKASSLYKQPSSTLSLNSRQGNGGSNLFRGFPLGLGLMGSSGRGQSLVSRLAVTFSFNDAFTRFGGLARGSRQTLSFADVARRATFLFRAPLQFFTFESATSRLGLLSRQPTQPLGLTIIGERMGGIVRYFVTLVQDFIVQPLAGRLTGTTRQSIQPLSFSSVSGRFAFLFKLPTQLMGFSIAETDQSGFARGYTQSFTLSSIASRTSGLFRIPLDILSLLNSAGRAAFLERTSGENVPLTVFTGRVAAFFKPITQSASFSTTSDSIFGITRTSAQAFGFELIAGRAVNLVRLPIQTLHFTTLATRVGGLTYYIITLQEQLSISSVSNRLYYALRSFSTTFEFLMSLFAQFTQGVIGGGGSPGGGEGGGSGTASQTTLLSDITIAPDRVALSLLQGEVQLTEFIITNQGDDSKTITLGSSDLENFVRFETASFELGPGEQRRINVLFFAANDTLPALYQGKIILTSGLLQREVLVAIDVGSKAPLFDVKLTIPSKFLRILAGSDLLAQVSLFNLGHLGRVDVVLDYIVKDALGNVVLSEHETLAVETQASAVKSLTLPRDLLPGDYVLYARATYNGTVVGSIASASAWFTVVPLPDFLRPLMISLGLLASLSALILFILFIRAYLNHRIIFRHKHISPSKPIVIHNLPTFDRPNV